MVMRAVHPLDKVAAVAVVLVAVTLMVMVVHLVLGALH
jgi:hypothetical protein